MASTGGRSSQMYRALAAPQDPSTHARNSKSQYKTLLSRITGLSGLDGTASVSASFIDLMSVEGTAGNSGMICNSTERSWYARGKALRQSMTSFIHLHGCPVQRYRGTLHVRRAGGTRNNTGPAGRETTRGQCQIWKMPSDSATTGHMPL